MKAIVSKSRKGLLLLLACVLMTQAVLPVYAVTQEDIDAAQDAADEAASALEEEQEKISGLEGEKTGLIKELSSLTSELTALDADLDELAGKVDEKELELDRTQAALERVKIDAADQYEDMKTRIRFMYEHGRSPILLVLVKAESVSDLLTRAEYYRQIVDYDRDKLLEYEETMDAVAAQEEKLKKEQADLTALMEEQKEKKAQLETLAEETDSRIDEYTALLGTEAEVEQELKEKLDAQKQIVADLIAKREEERRAAEEAARRQAEIERIAAEQKAAQEAAARAAAQQAQAQAAVQQAAAAQNTAPAVSEEDTPDDSSYAEEPAEPAPQPETPVSGGTYLGHFTLTAYCHCAACCGRAGGPTASGAMPVAGRTVAMYGIPLGTKLLINGHVYICEDRGTPYGHVDIFMNSHQEALNFGRQYADVYQLP